MQNAPLVLQGEHSAKLSTFIKLTVFIKTFVFSIFEWPFYTGFTVYLKSVIFGMYCTHLTMPLVCRWQWEFRIITIWSWSQRSGILKVSFMAHNANTFFYWRGSIVHILHNDCLWCIDHNKGLGSLVLKRIVYEHPKHMYRLTQIGKKKNSLLIWTCVLAFNLSITWSLYFTCNMYRLIWHLVWSLGLFKLN